ncbi:MAG: Hpt domain-containing protein [Opitutaceae bacterium]|nr:Hpt domain-containing protein [Opitutaceae bacterium]
MADPSVIDPQAIENLRALNPGDNDEFLREIIGIFLEDTPQRLDELEQSRAAGDVTRFARAAHSIKGSSSNLGAIALRAAAEKLEHQARSEGLDGITPHATAVRAEYERAAAALQALLAG